MSRKNHRCDAVNIIPQISDQSNTVSMAGNQSLFFSSDGASREFGPVLHEVQEYISSKYAVLITDGGTEEVKAQIKRYITKYVQDYRIAVTGMSQEQLVDALYTEMAEFSFLTKYIFGTGIEEIDVNAWNDIEVQYSSGITKKLDEHFDSPEHAINVVRRILHVSGMVLDNASPAILGHLSKNIRIAVLKTPLVDEDVGVSASIRTGTLRAQMDGHPPLVLGSQQGGAKICINLCPTITSAAGTSGNNQPVLFENHGIDSRYTGPHEVAPTMSARYGTGGNNVPLISQMNVISEDECGESPHPETYCIAGNIIDRQDHNGGNGMGFQPDISYTLNTADRHCVFSQQRSDEYVHNDVVSTQSARQYKDSTDLICDLVIAGLDCRNGTENGDLSGTLQSKTDGGYSLNNVHPVRIGKLIRRLTPLECERLQGFPDYWTDIPGASDSARYKALGNSVAIPCVEHVLRGIAYFLRKSYEEQEESECTSTPTT